MTEPVLFVSLFSQVTLQIFSSPYKNVKKKKRKCKLMKRKWAILQPLAINAHVLYVPKKIDVALEIAFFLFQFIFQDFRRS